MKILRTGPTGWEYYAWDEEKTIAAKTIHDHAIDLGIVGSVISKRKLMDADDVESFREFIHVVMGLAERDGFTHVFDIEMEMDEPEMIRKAIPKWIEVYWKSHERYHEIIKDVPPSVLSYPTVSN